MTDHDSTATAPQQQPVNHAALLLFGLLSLAIALLLLSLLGQQTTWVNGQPLVRQPALTSIVSLSGMALFGTIWLLLFWRNRRQTPIGNPLPELLQWLKGLEYLGWFMVYVWAVPLIGYLLATLLFCTLLAMRCGYRSRQAMFSAVLTGIAIVIIFKAMLSVKIPGGAIYESLPPAIRNFMILYL